ncbi:unnamed protein product [Absidia cylindrospora]
MHLSVKTVVRCCQPTYQAQRLAEQGIQVLDLPFKDGGLPPPQVIQNDEQQQQQQGDDDKTLHQKSQPTIAVHCVAGLGRAPVLVAIALIEMGMKPLDAIEYIRSKRRGAFNKPQIVFLDSYKRILKPKSSSSNYSLRSSLGRMFKLGSSSSSSSSSNNNNSKTTPDQH